MGAHPQTSYARGYRAYLMIALFSEGNARGAITFISKRFAPDESNCTSTPFVKGRVFRILIRRHLGKQIICNIYNFGLEKLTHSNLFRVPQGDIVECASDPAHENNFAVGECSCWIANLWGAS